MAIFFYFIWSISAAHVALRKTTGDFPVSIISLALFLVACSDNPNKAVAKPIAEVTPKKRPFIMPACKENADLFGRDIAGIPTIVINSSGTINGWCRDKEITVAFDKSHGCHVLACPQEQGYMWSINFSVDRTLGVQMEQTTYADIELNTECGGTRQAFIVTYAADRRSATVRCANGAELIVANAVWYRFVVH